MVSRTVKPVIKRFKKALNELGLPKTKLYLFGSYARGEARPDSDIDICLVSAAFKNKKTIYEKKIVLIAFRTDPRIQVIITYPEKFQKDKLSPLYSRIRKEAIAA